MNPYRSIFFLVSIVLFAFLSPACTSSVVNKQDSTQIQSDDVAKIQKKNIQTNRSNDIFESALTEKSKVSLRDIELKIKNLRDSEPNNVLAVYNYAAILERKGQYTDAFKLYGSIDKQSDVFPYAKIARAK